MVRYAVDGNTMVWTNVTDSFGEADGKKYMMFRVDRGEAWVFTQGGILLDVEYAGNRDYNIDDNSAIDGVTFQLETLEMSLGDVILHMAHSYAERNPSEIEIPISTEILVDGALKRIRELGYLEPPDSVRWNVRLIDEVFHKVLTEPRLIYMVFQVELEPGQAVTVTASYIQEPSMDVGGPKDFREGYDLATRLGSNLHFTNLESSISNTDAIELGKQNFGFDLEKGITEVTLDLNVEQYYLEVKLKN